MRHVVVLGAGLAGLACAYELSRAGARVTVLEREPDVGGMAASFCEGDRSTAGQPGSDYWSYDFGPHRFHTDDAELMRHIGLVLGENISWGRRQSRIFMGGRFFDYPLRVGNILANMPAWRIARFVSDYAWVRLLDLSGMVRFRDRNFREWVERRFGTSLARTFFVQYTEKTWGIPATEISADWASQRITLLNLGDTIKRTLFGQRNVPRTLVTDFVYPQVGGIGELARGYRREIERRGGEVLCGCPAIHVLREGSTVTAVEYGEGSALRRVSGDEYVSTIPVTALAASLRPKPPAAVASALRGLKYASIVFVYLKLDRPSVTDDHWVYLPEKSLTVHRFSEFKNFSPGCAPAGQTLLCAEITCRVGDATWNADTDALRLVAVGDLERVGLIDRREVIAAFTRRIPFAYPVYDTGYRQHLDVVLECVRGLSNLKSGGRQGLFRYNNMDHSIEMGRVMAAHAGRQSNEHEGVAVADDLFEPVVMNRLRVALASEGADAEEPLAAPPGSEGTPALADPANLRPVTACALCGGTGQRPHLTDGAFRVVRCTDCGLAYVTPRLVPEALAAVYDERYWRSTAPKHRGYADYAGAAPLYLRTFRKRWRLLAPRVGGPGRALDIGCAAGFFLQVLAGEGWDVHGVEPSEPIARQAAEALGADRVHVGTLGDAGHTPGSFDLVSLWDVVEHVPDPVSLLASAAALLAPGGTLVLETQNIESRFARLMGRGWQHYKHLEHLYHFDPRTTRRLCEAAGLRVVMQTSRCAGKHVSVGFIRERATRVHPFMATLLRPLAPLDRLSLYANPRDELIVVARKADGRG